MFAAIGATLFLFDLAIEPHIPEDYSKKYQLTFLTKEQCWGAIITGKINENTSRAGLIALRKELGSYSERGVPVPIIPREISPGMLKGRT